MKNSLLFLFLFACSCLFGQNQNIDSLWTIFNNKAFPDTNRLEAINDIAFSYMDTRPDSVIRIAKQELQLAQTFKQKKYEGNALIMIGGAYRNQGNYPYAMEYFLKALKKNEELGDKKK